MDEKTIELAYQLKDLLNRDERILELNKLEEEINNHREVITLVIAKDKANNEYNDLSRFLKDDDPSLIEARKKLMKAKEQLQTHPIVKQYLEKYREVEELYRFINEHLFDNMDASLCPH